jgi:hypothetical protein
MVERVVERGFEDGRHEQEVIADQRTAEVAACPIAEERRLW